MVDRVLEQNMMVNENLMKFFEYLLICPSCFHFSTVVPLVHLFVPSPTVLNLRLAVIEGVQFSFSLQEYFSDDRANEV